MELFYHNNLYLVSIYYIGEIEIISRNFSLNKMYKRNRGHSFSIEKDYQESIQPLRQGLARLHTTAADPCAQQRELLQYGLSSWPLPTTPAGLTPCSLPGLTCLSNTFSGTQTQTKTQHYGRSLASISCGIQHKTLLRVVSTVFVFLCLRYCCLQAKLSAPCSVLNCAEIAGA